MAKSFLFLLIQILTNVTTVVTVVMLMQHVTTRRGLTNVLATLAIMELVPTAWVSYHSSYLKRLKGCPIFVSYLQG